MKNSIYSRAGLRKSLAKKITAFVLTMSLAFAGTVTGYGAIKDVPSTETVKTEMEATANYFKDLFEVTAPTIYDYKNVILLMRSGIECQDIANQYLQTVKDNIVDGKLVISDNESVSMYAAVLTVLALSGEDATDYNGANLVKSFNDYAKTFTDAESMNTAIGNVYYYEMVVPAVFAYAEYMEDADSIKTVLKDALLSNYSENGSEAGVDYWGYSADTNATVIPAFNYFSEDSDVEIKITKSVDYVKSLMMEDGGTKYNTAAYSTSSNADSTGVSLCMYAEMSDNENAVKSYNGLMQFKGTTPGMYVYTAGGADNKMATGDALKGLVGYYLSLTGADGVFNVAAEVNAIMNKTSEEESTEKTTEKATETENNSNETTENQDYTEITETIPVTTESIVENNKETTETEAVDKKEETAAGAQTSDEHMPYVLLTMLAASAVVICAGYRRKEN